MPNSILPNSYNFRKSSRTNYWLLVLIYRGEHGKFFNHNEVSYLIGAKMLYDARQAGIPAERYCHVGDRLGKSRFFSQHWGMETALVMIAFIFTIW